MQFLSCDWGTSNFRLRLVESNTLEIVNEVILPEGIASTFSAWKKSQLPESHRLSFYKRVLQKAIERFGPLGQAPIPLILSGMASSSLGLVELEYMEFPFGLDAGELKFELIEEDDNLANPIYLISGARTENDIMRGEETILLGCAGTDKETGIYIFPGTHSKHVFVQDSKAVGFKTYLTGEIFNLLVTQSILKNSVAPGESITPFFQGVAESEKGELLHSLFSIRAKDILHGTDHVQNYQYLSGLLIGTELRKLPNSKDSIHIVGEEPLLGLYASAMEMIDGKCKVILQSSDQALLRGHLSFLIAKGIIPVF